jgi:hypothetical protein
MEVVKESKGEFLKGPDSPDAQRKYCAAEEDDPIQSNPSKYF